VSLCRALVEYGWKDVGAETLDRVERGIVLGPGGRDGKHRRDSGCGVHLGGCDSGDSVVARNGVDEWLNHAVILRDVDCDDQRPVGAGAETLGDEVVGPTLRSVFG
jgi:hypothetical protein